MIRIDLYRSGDRILGYACSGHAGSGAYGYDVVCSAVSVLAINTANAIEHLTDADLEEEENPEGGYLKVMLTDPEIPDAQLLMKALDMGVSQIAENYPDYVRVRIVEVRR